MQGPLARVRSARAANHPTPERQLEMERELWLHLEREGASGARGVPTAALVRIL